MWMTSCDSKPLCITKFVYGLILNESNICIVAKKQRCSLCVKWFSSSYVLSLSLSQFLLHGGISFHICRFSFSTIIDAHIFWIYKKTNLENYIALNYYNMWHTMIIIDVCKDKMIILSLQMKKEINPKMSQRSVHFYVFLISEKLDSTFLDFHHCLLTLT